MTAPPFHFSIFFRRTALLILIAFCPCDPLHSKTNPWPITPSVSQSLGEASLSVASMRFNKNRADPKAFQLLRLSDLLCTLSRDKVFYLKGLLESGANIPDKAFGPATNEGDLAKHFVKFAGSRPSHFQLLLFSSAYLLDPHNKEVTVAIQRAKRRGLNTDFEYLLRNVNQPIPTFALNPPYLPELPSNEGKTLAGLAAEYATEKLYENRESLLGKRMVALGLLVDPENEELLYLMSILGMGKPSESVSQTSMKNPLLRKLAETSTRKGNSTLLNNLLHASMIEIEPDRFASIVFLQKMKERGIKIDFESIALEYEQFLKKNRTPDRPPSSTVQKGELLDADLSNLLTAKRWTLTELHTKQTWFVSFRRTSKSIFKPEGKCQGVRGNNLHTWNSWKIKNSILIIDGYARYAYDRNSKAWRQASGKKDSFFH